MKWKSSVISGWFSLCDENNRALAPLAMHVEEEAV
jgi:hypothetical protein